MSWTAPSIDDFKSRFARDFPFANEKDPDNLDFITDGDIQNAIDYATMDFNEGIFGAATGATYLFLLLTAYHLVENIQTSQKGLSAQSQFVTENISVGGVSVGNIVSERIAADPVLSKYMKNAYGQKYIEMALPYLVGRVAVVSGRTTTA